MYIFKYASTHVDMQIRKYSGQMQKKFGLGIRDRGSVCLFDRPQSLIPRQDEEGHKKLKGREETTRDEMK